MLPAGYRALYFEGLDSTNAEALRRVEAGEAGRLWIWAGTQSRGRGRGGRHWHSEEGNLFATLLLRPACTLETALQLTLLAGVAVHDAVGEVMGAGAARSALVLKWPNDLLLYEQKLAGLLLESVGPVASDRYAVVMGTGINLATAPEGATSLSRHGIRETPGRVLEVLAAKTDQWLTIWGEGAGFDRIREAWQERAMEIGRAISVKLGTQLREGRYGGIDEAGALRLLAPSGETRITTGDVFLN